MAKKKKKVKSLYILIHVYYKEKVYSVYVTGINQDWTCGWGKEKRCINCVISWRKTVYIVNVFCLAVYIYYMYKLYSYTVIVILKENMYM